MGGNGGGYQEVCVRVPPVGGSELHAGPVLGPDRRPYHVQISDDHARTLLGENADVRALVKTVVKDRGIHSLTASS